MYKGIKTVNGPTSVKNAPLKLKICEFIYWTEKAAVDHYLKVYSTQNIVADAAFDSSPGLLFIEDCLLIVKYSGTF